MVTCEHNWRFVEVGKYVGCGVLIAFRCTKCGLFRNESLWEKGPYYERSNRQSKGKENDPQ